MVRVRVEWLVGFVVLVPAGPSFAGAWTQPEGHGRAAITGVWSSADQAFDGSGNTQATPRTNKFELQGLFEYGITDRLTLMAMPVLQHVDIAPPVNAERNGLGTVEAGGRYRFFDGPWWVISGQATVRSPGAFEPTTPALIGSSQPEADIRALFGASTSIAGWGSFFDLQVAQRFRGGDVPSEARLDATFGISPLPAWHLWLQSFNTFAEGSTTLVPSYTYHKLQLSVVYDLTPAWALQFGGYSTVAGTNALQENGVLLGTWYRF